MIEMVSSVLVLNPLVMEIWVFGGNLECVTTASILGAILSPLAREDPQLNFKFECGEGKEWQEESNKLLDNNNNNEE